MKTQLWLARGVVAASWSSFPPWRYRLGGHLRIGVTFLDWLGFVVGDGDYVGGLAERLFWLGSRSSRCGFLHDRGTQAALLVFGQDFLA